MSIFDADYNTQLQEMAYKIFVMAPTMFFSRKLYDIVGGFNEKYIYEDHPFYMDVLEHGHKIYFVNITSVGYRIHNSTVHSKSKLFNYTFAQNSKRFREERCYKYYSKSQLLASKMYYLLLDIYEKMGWNKKSKISYFVYDFLRNSIWGLGNVLNFNKS